MTESKDSIISNLRAIIISSKNGLKLQDVTVDYKEAFGENIPLENLGYNSLSEFFKKNPENFILTDNKVEVVTKSSSVHISSLVSRQRNARKKGRSKLSSKEARHIRKPSQISNYPFPGVQSKKKPNTQKNSRFKENLSASLRALQLQHVANSNKIEENVSMQSKVEDKITVGKSENDLKDTIQKKEYGSCSNNNNNEEDIVLFQDVEDLNEAIKPQSRLLKMRSITNKIPQTANNETASDKMNDIKPSSLCSPFARLLANNSQPEILCAKKSAASNEFEKEKKNFKLNSLNLTSVSLPSDQEDNAIYEFKLKNFCIEKGLILPSYSVIVRNTNNLTKLYGCKLTMGDSFQVSTYPIETHSESAAREIVSKKAYMHLSANNNLPLLIYDTKNVIKLRELCTINNLPEPIFTPIELHLKNEPKSFICKVKIGNDILLSSYPAEMKDEFSARDCVAQKACDHLISRNKSPLRNLKNESDVLKEIFDMIKSKDYGVWSNKLPNLYLETYNEEIKSNWLELVKKSPKFEINNIEKIGLIIRAINCNEEDLNVTEQLTLPLLKVPESDQWEVYITNVVTSAEIWCRLIGKEYSELYYNMMTKLELQPPTECVKKPVVDGIYLVNLEESWNRVKVIETFTEKDEISVFLIDIGVDEIVKPSQLFYLPKQFFSVAPQALLLSLNELDCLVECEELQNALFHSLLGNPFIAEIVAILDEGGNVSSVNLWDTSTEDDINFNLKLLDDVIKTIKSPTLPTLGIVKEMFVCYVDDDGCIYLQKSEQHINFIENIISIKMKYSGLLKPVNFKKLDPQKLYVTKFTKNGLFCRAKLSTVLNSNFAIMKFIDYGYEEKISINDLFDLEQTSFDLATIPSQAIQVKLACKKPLTNKAVAKIREYVFQRNVLVKVLQNGYPPHVELLQRSQSDGTLSSVGSKLDNDEQLREEDPPTRKKSYVIGLENTLSKNLPMPNIPPIGSYFNVFVTLAAHPGLLNVQPLATRVELLELMFRLQEKCEQTFSHPLSPTDFKIGELYAVKHSDESWYRAYAHAVISPSAYSVCLCDFGDFIMAPSQKIMLLPNEFKMFPYQAIRAYLAGIAPANKDWLALDCVNFRELVIDKQFVSEIKEINRDVKNPNYISLGLTLIDTSTSEDININNVLVKKKIAILKS